MQLRGHGIRAELPRGWEGAIRREPMHVDGEVGPFAAAAAAAAAAKGPPVVHLATFALPNERGDFGSGAVDLMADDDAFVALLEYGTEEADTPLFAAQGLPRRLDPRTFSTRSLQRSMRNQAGWQHFFTEAGRAFCLYVVLGDHGDVNRQVRRVEAVLAQISIDPAQPGEERP
ncbi:hypothetical protein [Egicoccus halophilus]|uniref:Uncharacterized protein n=1 Tax=Egicoccus halophilus TaxID=1670830 RepID=A0A8J3ACY4_9ACTN|nr:hypothetical protein [Egicoccus halophilus]GGI09052.1 hypothetical protein GCM10011354_32150 [Egicoccus halophilus]